MALCWNSCFQEMLFCSKTDKTIKDHNSWLIQKPVRLWPADPQSSKAFHESTDGWKVFISQLERPVYLYCLCLHIQVEWPPCCTRRRASLCQVSTDPLEAYTHLISCSSIHSPHIQITSLVSLAIAAVNVVLDGTKWQGGKQSYSVWSCQSVPIIHSI